jgi:hypothetical protein
MSAWCVPCASGREIVADQVSDVRVDAAAKTP